MLRYATLAANLNGCLNHRCPFETSEVQITYCVVKADRHFLIHFIGQIGYKNY